MMKPSKYTTFFLFSMHLLFCACTTNSSEVGQAEELAVVKVQVLAPQKIKITQDFPAKIVANQMITIKTEVGGTIEKIHFQEGSFVRKGTVLYSIDQTRYVAQYKESVARLEAAKATWEQAEKNAQRYRNLHEKQAVETVELERIVLQAQNTKSAYSVAEAELNRVEANLRYATIKAPFDGYIGISRVKIGDLVTPNQTILAVLAEKNTMLADIFVSEKDYFNLILQAQEVKLENIFDFELILPNGERYAEHGKLKFVDNLIDPSTGTLRMQIVFNNPNDILKPGINAKVEVEVKAETQKPSLAIPQRVIRKLLNQNFVYVIDEAGKVEERKLELGPSFENLQIIKQGLSAGDKLVVEGMQGLKAGQTVRINAEK
jgi:membrane fusion protein (multidrug efflux system)